VQVTLWLWITSLIVGGGCATPRQIGVDTATANSVAVVPSAAKPATQTTVAAETKVEQVDYRADSKLTFVDVESAEPESAEPESAEPESAEAELAEAESAREAEPLPAADAMPSQATSVRTLIDRALTRHPEIAAARQRVAALRHSIVVASSLEDPQFRNTFWPIRDHALQTAGGRMGNQMMVSQKLPWPEKLAARSNVARRDVQVAIAEVQQAEQKVIESVRLAYQRLWLAEQHDAIVQENQQLAEELVTVAEARYAAGGTQSDVLRAIRERDELERDLIRLRKQRRQAAADLATLVGSPREASFTTAGKPLHPASLPELDELVATAESLNPRLQGLAAEVARDRAKQTVACLERYPDFQLGVGWNLISDNQDVISPVADGHDNVNFSVGVTLPIWRDKLGALSGEAVHRRRSTESIRQAERDRVSGQLRQLIAEAEAVIEQLALFRDRLVPRTEELLEITTADYQVDKADFDEVIALFDELLQYRVQIVRAEAQLAATAARIERLVGAPLKAENASGEPARG
jgi:outer membrane protein TolC